MVPWYWINISEWRNTLMIIIMESKPMRFGGRDKWTQFPCNGRSKARRRQGDELLPDSPLLSGEFPPAPFQILTSYEFIGLSVPQRFIMASKMVNTSVKSSIQNWDLILISKESGKECYIVCHCTAPLQSSYGWASFNLYKDLRSQFLVIYFAIRCNVLADDFSILIHLLPLMFFSIRKEHIE